MSEIKALEKMRKYVSEWWAPDEAVNEDVNNFADEIQAEVDERFMELPEGWTTEQACEVLGYWPRWDDGAPCMFGDVFSTPRYAPEDKNEKLEILRIFARDHVFKKQDGTPYEKEHGGYYEWNYFRPGGEGCDEYKPHHVKPRTLESVLQEYGSEIADSASKPWSEIVDKYADEIRELLGVGE